MRFIVTVVFLIFMYGTVDAQCPMPPCPPGPPGPPPPNPVPITGIEILLGVGALLGARKFVQGRKKEEAGD